MEQKNSSHDILSASSCDWNYVEKLDNYKTKHKLYLLHMKKVSSVNVFLTALHILRSPFRDLATLHDLVYTAKYLVLARLIHPAVSLR
jgi:hypothetical protein